MCGLLAGRECEHQLPVGSSDVCVPHAWGGCIRAQLTAVHHRANQDASRAHSCCVQKSTGSQFKVMLLLSLRHLL